MTRRFSHVPHLKKYRASLSLGGMIPLAPPPAIQIQIPDSLGSAPPHVLHHRPMKFSLALATILALGNLTSASSNDIRQIDFRNFRYRPSCLRLADSPSEIEQAQLKGEGESVVVTNGIFKKETPEDPLDFRILEVNYGELNSNAVAVVTTVCNTGGSGNFSEGYVFGVANGKPKLIAIIPGGDRANGGIRSATVEHGLLRVGRYGTDGGACCPKWVEVRDYKFLSGKLVEVGVERREKYVEK